MKIEVSIGEFLDKISILEIKEERIRDQEKIKEIRKELEEIMNELDNKYRGSIEDLKRVNKVLWDIENKIREKEHKGEFDQEFIELARSVYKTNDLRFKLKDSINKMFYSKIKEVKGYNDINV